MTSGKQEQQMHLRQARIDSIVDVQMISGADSVLPLGDTLNDVGMAWPVVHRPLTEEEYPALAAIWDNPSDDVFDTM